MTMYCFIERSIVFCTEKMLFKMFSNKIKKLLCIVHLLSMLFKQVIHCSEWMTNQLL